MTARTKSILTFLGGLVTGVVLTFVVSTIISSASSSDDELVIFDQPGQEIEAEYFWVMQVFPDGDALAMIMPSVGTIVLLLADETTSYYDGQNIDVPDGKRAVQIGTYRYVTKSELVKTVPVVEIVDSHGLPQCHIRPMRPRGWPAAMPRTSTPQRRGDTCVARMTAAMPHSARAPARMAYRNIAIDRQHCGHRRAQFRGHLVPFRHRASQVAPLRALSRIGLPQCRIRPVRPRGWPAAISRASTPQRRGDTCVARMTAAMPHSARAPAWLVCRNIADERPAA